MAPVLLQWKNSCRSVTLKVNSCRSVTLKSLGSTALEHLADSFSCSFVRLSIFSFGCGVYQRPPLTPSRLNFTVAVQKLIRLMLDVLVLLIGL